MNLESVQSLSSLEKRALKALSYRAGVAATLINAWSNASLDSSQTVRSLIDMAGFGVTEEVATNEVLAELTSLELISKSALGFRICADKHKALARISLALHAVAYYASTIHKDQSTAKVVLTRPPQPSKLEQQLANRGWRTAELETTRDAFKTLVRGARRRVVVMTPFLDLGGAEWLCQLYESVHEGVDRILILRTLEKPLRPDFPVGYTKAALRLRDADVRVFNYSIPREGSFGRETFHAKVVLCDEDKAYVGSSNLTVASLEHSMELGISLSGRVGAQVAIVMDAVLACATPWPYTA